MQTFNKYNDVPYSFLATNTNIYLTTQEIIILDEIDTNGITSFAVTINNKTNSTGSVLTVIVYGSEDGVNWYILQDDIFPNHITSGTVQHSEFFNLAGTIRITATASNNNTNIDVYFRGASI